MAVVLRLVRGNATPEELGAVVALLAARSGGVAESETPTTPSAWGAPRLRQPMPAPGPGAWHAAVL